jgi:type IV fimbrial biogenesis protein FimT
MLNRYGQRGVSMIEVAITMALMAVLLFAVAPEVTSMVANSRIRSSTESLQQGLQRARNEALRRNQGVTFWLATLNASSSLDNTCTLSASARGWVVSINDPSGKCAAASSDTTDPLLIEKAVGGGTGSNVTVTALQSDGTTAATHVTFDGFGRVPEAAAIARIDLDNASTGNNFRPLRIEVTRGGSVRLCEPRAAASDPRHCS